MDAVNAYRAAALSTPNLLAAVRRIEKNALLSMKNEGYGINLLRTALHESRYPLLFDDREAVNEYLREILPQDAGEDTRLDLPAPGARFNALYEKPLRQIAGILEAADQMILQNLREQRIPRGEVREAYLGGSLYGTLAGDTAERTAFEHRVWKKHREAIMASVKTETEGMQSLFQEVWERRSKEAARPIAVREGEGITRFLRDSNAQEETAAQLLMGATDYEGRDKDAYVRKIASAAVREISVYDGIDAASTDVESDTEVYRACLKDAMRTLRRDTLPYEAEAQIVGALRSAGMDEEMLREGILRASPLLAAAGRDADKTLAALLSGETEQASFLDGDYVKFADIYQRLITDYDDALIDAGADSGVMADRRHYNVLAARELLTKYGASEEEVRELLLAFGGIPDHERTQEYLNKILAEAREVQEVSAGIITAKEPQTDMSSVWEGAPRTQGDAVRIRTQDVAESTEAAEKVQESTLLYSLRPTRKVFAKRSTSSGRIPLRVSACAYAARKMQRKCMRTAVRRLSGIFRCHLTGKWMSRSSCIFSPSAMRSARSRMRFSITPRADARRRITQRIL